MKAKMTMSYEFSEMRIDNSTTVNLNDLVDKNEFELSWPDVCGFVWHGSLHVLISCYRKDNLKCFTLFLRLHPDGKFQHLDTTEEQRLALEQSLIAPTPDGLVLIPHSTMPPQLADPVRIAFLPRSDIGFGPTRQIEIEHDLPLSQTPNGGPYGRDFAQETGRILHGGAIGKDFVVAAPFRMADTVRAVAFLKIDAAFKSARWETSIVGKGPSLATRLGKMFGQSEASALAIDDLLTLQGDDYPVHAGFKGKPVWPLEVSTDGTALYVFSRGANESTKYGSFGTVIAQIEMSGRISRRICFEDYTESAKYQARKGAFFDGGRAFVMHSEFKATDPWNGGWAHVRIPDGKTTVLRPPHGHKDMRILDLDGRVIWLWEEAADCVKISQASW